MNMHSTFIFGRDRLTLVPATYGDGATAIRVVTEDGEPFCTLSARLADDPLPDGVFRAKCYSENEQIAAFLIGAGLITRVEGIAPRPSGYVVLEAFRLAGPERRGEL